MPEPSPLAGPPPLPGREPVRRAERIDVLDIMRGLAVLGILVMNIQAFGLVRIAYENPFYAGPLDALDHAVWLAGRFLVSGRALAVFAILFGAGVILSTRRLDDAGVPGAGLFYRRYGILFAIGMLHAYFLWFGDILHAYAVGAFLIYPLRRARVAIQLTLGVLAVAASGLIIALLAGFFTAHPAFAEEFRSFWWPSRDMLAGEIAAMRGSWSQWFVHNAESAVYQQLTTGLLGYFVFAAGLMLVGMTLLRSGFFEHRWSPAAYRVGAALGIANGLAASTVAWAFDRDMAWTTGEAVLRHLAFELSGPLAAFGYLCLVMILVHRLRFLRIFAPVGRMALTNYLAQSAIGALIFYGFGLGLFERLDHTALLIVALAVFAIQTVASRWWLARFRFGPAEWLWRRLSYGPLPASPRPPSGSASTGSSADHGTFPSDLGK